MARNEKVIELEYPIKYNGVELDKITLRTRFKVKDMQYFRDLPAGITPEEAKKVRIDPQDMIGLIASLTGLPISTIEEIDMEDLSKIAEEFQNFHKAVPQETGHK